MRTVKNIGPAFSPRFIVSRQKPMLPSAKPAMSAASHAVKDFHQQLLSFEACFAGGRILEAARSAQETLIWVDGKGNGDVGFYLVALQNWVDVLLALGQIANAQQAVREARGRFSSRLGEDSPFRGLLYCAEAKVHFHSGEYALVVQKTQKAAELFSTHKPFNSQVPRALSRQCEALVALGRLVEAENAVKKAIEMVAGFNDPKLNAPESCLPFLLSDVLVRQGKFLEARTVLLALRNKFRAIEEAHPAFLAEWLGHYGVVLLALGEGSDAKVVFNQTLERRLVLDGENTPGVYGVLRHLFQIAVNQKELETALSLSTRLASIARAIYGTGSFHYAESLKRLMRLQAALGLQSAAHATLAEAEASEAVFLAQAVDHFRSRVLPEFALFDERMEVKPDHVFRHCSAFFLSPEDFRRLSRATDEDDSEDPFERVHTFFRSRLEAQNSVATKILRFASMSICDPANDEIKCVAVFLFAFTAEAMAAGGDVEQGIVQQIVGDLYVERVAPLLPMQEGVEVFQSYLGSNQDPFFARHGRLYVQAHLVLDALTVFRWFPFEELFPGAASDHPNANSKSESDYASSLGKLISPMMMHLEVAGKDFVHEFVPIVVTAPGQVGFRKQGAMLSLTVAPRGSAIDREKIRERGEALYYAFVLGSQT